MTSEEKEAFIIYLQEKRQKLLSRIKELKDLSLIESPDCAVDKINRENSFYDKAVFRESLVKAENELEIISSVLKRIDSGNFGICEKCGKDIEVNLLKVKPESRFCINCLKMNK